MKGDAIDAGFGSGRYPVNACLAVEGTGHNRGIRRQANGRERQRLLVQVAGLQGELEGLPMTATLSPI